MIISKYYVYFYLFIFNMLFLMGHGGHHIKKETFSVSWQKVKSYISVETICLTPGKETNQLSSYPDEKLR